jgi:MFS family permease
MTRSLGPFLSLFLSTTILLLGDGLFGTLIPVRGNLNGFSATSLGLMGSAYFGGYMLGALFGPAGIMRVGHIRSFAVFASIASAAPLAHMLFSEAVVWVVLRVATGFCIAGLYMIIESWLNEQASNSNRGSVFAVYRVVSLAALTLGQLALNLFDPSGFELFAVVAILTSFALVPVSLTKAVQPAPLVTARVSLRELWSISPVGVFGCLVVGLTTGPFWALGPIYAGEVGLDVQGISFFMTLAVLGGALLQVPVGRLSDRIDRRWVLVGVLAGVALSGGYLATAPGLVGPLGIYLGTFAFGAFALSLYGLCVAQTNDHAAPHQFVLVASGLTLVFSVGAMVGPLFISALIGVFGIGAVFGLPALVDALFILFVLGRIFSREAVPAEDKEDFVAVPISQTTSAPLELDPRADGDDEQSST